MKTPEDCHPGHAHPLPGWLLAVLCICVIGLMASIVLVSYQGVETNRRIGALEDYVAGRGEVRDRENAALNARIDEAVRLSKCDLLDRLPANSPLLDPIRAEYRCGPGVPLESLPPEVQNQLRGSSPGSAGPVILPRQPPQVTSAPAAPSRVTPSSSAPSQAPTVASPTPVPATPAPTTSAPPLVNTNPIAEPVCDLLGICF